MNKNKIYLAVLVTALILFGCVELPSDKGLTFGAINIPESPSDLGETCKLQAGQEEPWVISDNQVCTGGYIEMNGQTIRITETGSLTLNGVSIDMDGGILETFGDLNIFQSSVISGSSYIFYGHDGSNIFIENSQISNAGSKESSYLPHRGIYVEGSSTTLNITNSIINSGDADYGIIVNEVEDINIYDTEFSNFNEAAIHTISSTGLINKNDITGGNYGIYAVYFKGYEGSYDLTINENTIDGSTTAIYIDPPQCGNGQCEVSSCEGDQQLDCSVLDQAECENNIAFGCGWKGEACSMEIIDCSRFNNQESLCTEFGCTFYEAETVNTCPEDCSPPCTLDTQVCPNQGCNYIDKDGKCFANENCANCVEKNCEDLIDDDMDGAIDCDDSDCAQNPVCQVTPECVEYGQCLESCLPCWTNDEGATLFADENCNEVCPSPVVCGDGKIEGQEQCEQNEDCPKNGYPENYVCTNCMCVEPQPQVPACSGNAVDVCEQLDNVQLCLESFQSGDTYYQCSWNDAKGICSPSQQCTYEQPQTCIYDEAQCPTQGCNYFDINTAQCFQDEACSVECEPQLPACSGEAIYDCNDLNELQFPEEECMNYYEIIAEENDFYSQCTFDPKNGGCMRGLQCTYEEPQQQETNCSDGVDNDNDGLTDCADSNCEVEMLCEVMTPPINAQQGSPSFNFVIQSNTISNAQTGILFQGFEKGMNINANINSNTLCENVNTLFMNADPYSFESNICNWPQPFCTETCPVEGPVCGNGQCEDGEDYNSCPEDCEAPVEKNWEAAEQCINNIYSSTQINLDECNNDGQCMELVKQNMMTEIINCKEQYAPENIYKSDNQIICGDGYCNYPKENSKICPQDCKEKVDTIVSLVDKNGLKKYEQKEIDYSKAIEETGGNMTLTISEENKVCVPNEVCEIEFIIANNGNEDNYAKVRLEVDSDDAKIISSIDMKQYGLNSEGSATDNEINTKDTSTENNKMYYDFGGTEAVSGILVPAGASTIVTFEVTPKNGVFKYSVYLDSEKGDQIYIDPTVISPPIYVNENYVVESDLEVNGTLFIINASDVTLDCAGYTLTGNTTANGIHNNNYDNVTIRNCIITNFHYGIYFGASSQNNISNNNISFNYDGIHLHSLCESNVIDGNIVNNNENNGIYLFDSSFNNIDNNIVNSNNNGIYIYEGGAAASNNNSINNNSACYNTNKDIMLEMEFSTWNVGEENTCDNLLDGGNAVSCSAACEQQIETPECTGNEVATCEEIQEASEEVCALYYVIAGETTGQQCMFDGAAMCMPGGDDRNCTISVLVDPLVVSLTQPNPGSIIQEQTVIVGYSTNDITSDCSVYLFSQNEGVWTEHCNIQSVTSATCQLGPLENGGYSWGVNCSESEDPSNIYETPEEGLYTFTIDYEEEPQVPTCSGNPTDGCELLNIEEECSQSFQSGNTNYQCVWNEGKGNCQAGDECTYEEPQQEETNCSDGVDNEGDGLIDCEDPDCHGQSGSPPSENWANCVCDIDSPQSSYRIECTSDSSQCSDGVDNDGDGKVDCEDSDCEGVPACEEVGCGIDPVLCPNPECTYTSGGQCYIDVQCSALCGTEYCVDGIDNDRDGKVDCEDSDCSEDEACQEISSCVGEVVDSCEVEGEYCDQILQMIGSGVNVYSTQGYQCVISYTGGCVNGNQCTVEQPSCVFNANVCPDCDICGGTASVCGIFGNSEECNTQTGCTWQEEVQESCEGVATCSKISDQELCNYFSTCSWDSQNMICMGTTGDCSEIQEIGLCFEPFCTLTPPQQAFCSGTPSECSSLNSEVCTSQIGCSLGGYTNDGGVTCYQDNACSIACEEVVEPVECDTNRMCNIGAGPIDDFCGLGRCEGTEYPITHSCELSADSLENCIELVSNPGLKIQYPYYSDGANTCILGNYEGSGVIYEEFQLDCNLLGGSEPSINSVTVTTCDCSVDCSDPTNRDEAECCFDPTNSSTFYGRVVEVENVLYIKEQVTLCSGEFNLPASGTGFYDAKGNWLNESQIKEGTAYAIILDSTDSALYGPVDGTAYLIGEDYGTAIWLHGTDAVFDGRNNVVIQNYAEGVLAESKLIRDDQFNIRNFSITDCGIGFHARPNLKLLENGETTISNLRNVTINGEACEYGIYFEQAGDSGLVKGVIEGGDINCVMPVFAFNAQFINTILKGRDTFKDANGFKTIMGIKPKNTQASGVPEKYQFKGISIQIDPTTKSGEGKYIDIEEPIDYIYDPEVSDYSFAIKEKAYGEYGLAWKSNLTLTEGLDMNKVNFADKFVAINSQEISSEYLENKTIEVSLKLQNGVNCSNVDVFKTSSFATTENDVKTAQDRIVVIQNGQSMVEYIDVVSCLNPDSKSGTAGKFVFYVINGTWSSYAVGEEGSPEITDISIEPSSPYSSDDLICSVTTWDGEQENLLVRYWWTKDDSRGNAGDYGNEGMKVCTINEECELGTVLDGYTDVGDVWACYAYADDGNGYISSTESDSVTIGEEDSDEICDDEIDNDGDGDIDCADPNCEYQLGPNGEVCEFLNETLCTDGYDNDADGLVDCCDTEDCSCTAGTSCNLNTCTCVSSGGGDDSSDPNLEMDTSGEYCIGEEITFTITDEDSNLIETAKISESNEGLGTLGYTNSIGELRYTFDNTGNYRIDVSKSGYDAAYQYITISDCTTLSYCTSNNDCLDGYYCNGIQCVELECLPGFTVSGHSCVAPKECQTDGGCKYDQYCSDEGYCEMVECECGYIADHLCNEYECCSDTDCEGTLDVCVNHICTSVGPDIISQTEGQTVEEFERDMLNTKAELGILYTLIEEAKTKGQNVDETQELLDEARAYVLKGDFENAELTIQKAKSQVTDEKSETRIVYVALLIIILLISMMLWHNKTKEIKPTNTSKTKPKKRTRKKTRKKK